MDEVGVAILSTIVLKMSTEWELGRRAHEGCRGRAEAEDCSGTSAWEEGLASPGRRFKFEIAGSAAPLDLEAAAGYGGGVHRGETSGACPLFCLWR